MSTPGWAAGLGPFLIAHDRGYFKEEGIDIEFVEAGGGVATPALISDSLDISLSGSTAINAILKGAELRLIYVAADRTPYQLWATQPELKTLADLKGKVVGVASRGDTFEIAMRRALRGAGMSPDDVGYAAVGFGGGGSHRAVLQSGSLPAIVMTSFDVESLRSTDALGRSHMIQDFAKTIRMPYRGVATSARLLKGKPSVVRGFLKASLKGQRFMVAFKDASISVLERYSKNKNTSTIASDYATTLPTLTADGTMPDEIARADLEERAGITNLSGGAPPVAAVYDFAPLRAVISELDTSGWKPSP